MDADLLKLLGQNKLMKGMTDAHIRALSAHLRVESFPAGAAIVRQSQVPDRVHLLVRGQAQVRRASPGSVENAMAELAEGDFFGEMAVVLGADAHSSSVIAASPATTLSFSAEDFRRFVADSPAAMHNMLADIVLQLQAMNARWVERLRVETQVLEEKVRERTQALEEVGERVHRELILAQNIQRNLLPEKRSSYPGIDIRTEYIPCDELGGDITGVFRIDETHLGVYGGDVCGHGIYAAMVMSYVKKLIETSFKRILLNRQYVVKPPGAVLTTINQSFISEISQGDPEIYLTLFLAVLDMEHLTLTYASAGTHCPPLVLSGGNAALLFTQSDFAVGHVPNHEYATNRHTFGKGDVFLFVSDGVIEASRGGELFGMERLMRDAVAVVRESGSLDVHAVVGSVRSFLGGEPPQDDMCLLTIEFTGVDEPAR